MVMRCWLVGSLVAVRWGGQVSNHDTHSNRDRRYGWMGQGGLGPSIKESHNLVTIGCRDRLVLAYRSKLIWI